MKSVTDPSVQLIKSALKAGLEKSGHTLEELESSIASRDTEKTGALLKQAGWNDVLRAIPQAGVLGFKGMALLGGTGALLGGSGIYGAYKGLEDTQKKIDEQEAVRQRLIQARRELEAQMLQPEGVQ